MNIDLGKLKKPDALSIPFNEELFALYELEEIMQPAPGEEATGNKSIRIEEGKSYLGISPEDLEKMPPLDKSAALRQRILKLWYEKAEGSYAKLEVETQILEDTFRKWLKGSRNMKRSNLAKFIVGFSLDIETADELFALHDHPLDCDGDRFDFIVACAIRDKDDIEQFGNDVLAYCNLQLF